MTTVGRVVALLAGAGAALCVLLSAVRTVVVPRGEPVLLTRVLFDSLKWVFELRLRLRRVSSYEDRDRTMALYAPLALVLLPGLWMALLVGAFTLVFWGVGVDPMRRAFELSGSSLLTLGFERPRDLGGTIASFVEATLGLGLIALIISYLPSIYAAFQRRELAVAELAARAGQPPSAIEMIVRHHELDRLDALDDLWDEWARWFADVEETHTSQPALVWFRSISHERSWVTAAGVVLDTASLRSALLAGPRDPRAELCVRAGYLALCRIAAHYSLPFDANPRRGDPISIDRSEFDDAYERLAAAGVPLRPDRQLAWEDFAGWRVNYDRPLLGLAGMVMAPYALWSSDRSVAPPRPPLLRLGRNHRGGGGDHGWGDQRGRRPRHPLP